MQTVRLSEMLEAHPTSTRHQHPTTQWISTLNLIKAWNL